MRSSFIFASVGLILTLIPTLNFYAQADTMPLGIEAKTTFSVIPKELQVSQNEKLILKVAAKGVQIYTCGLKPDSSKEFSWSLKAPKADLYNETGEKVGIHYGGPTWESLDSSKIRGKVQAKVNSPIADSIPLLLLEVISREGAGIFSNVEKLQRLNTVGGQPPVDGCDATMKDAEARVGYTADYYFYGKPAVK